MSENCKQWFENKFSPALNSQNIEAIYLTKQSYSDFLECWRTAQKAAIPQGYMLVPIEPTDEMLDVAWESPKIQSGLTRRNLFNESLTVVYKAMLEVAQGDSHE